VNGRVDIGNAGLDAGAQDRHIEEGRAGIEHDLAFGLPNQGLGGLDIHGVELMGGNEAGTLEQLALENAGDDGLAFGQSPRGDVDVPEDIIVHGSLNGCDLRDTSGTDDQNVLFQLARNTFLAVDIIQV
jgi:hypothetical protein